MPLFRFRRALFALVAVMVTGLSAAGLSPARADSGSITINVIKGGWFVGASGGSGVLLFRGEMYPISIGGLSAGLVFGASQTSLSGKVTNIFKPSDVAGVYGAGGAGVAFGGGVGGIILTNEKGAVLQLSGKQTGLMFNADLSGLAITIKE
jgi:hypothetical protein